MHISSKLYQNNGTGTEMGTEKETKKSNANGKAQ